jgi:polyferredoxin
MTRDDWRTCSRCHAKFKFYPELPHEVRQDLCEQCVYVVEESV